MWDAISRSFTTDCRARVILGILILAAPLPALAPRQINPLVTEHYLALGDSLLLPAGYQVEAMQPGQITMNVAEGNGQIKGFVWAFQTGDTWPMDGNTTLKQTQDTVYAFRAANCRVTVQGAAGIQQATTIQLLAADVCKP